MNEAAIGFLTGIGWFTAYVVGHWVVMAAVQVRNPSRLLKHGMILAGLGCLGTGVELAAGQGLVLFLIYALLTLACLFVLYTPFFYTITTSLSVQSLIMAAERGGRIELTVLLDRFASARILVPRFAAMVLAGYLQQTDGGRYAATDRARRMARTFLAVKGFWRLGAGG